MHKHPRSQPTNPPTQPTTDLMLSLPPDLESAIAQALRALPPSQWQAAARHLSQRYRQAEDERRKTKDEQHPSAAQARSIRNLKSKIQNSDALGYAGLVLPAAYAQLWGAMRATILRAPAFHPTTMLDLGSGPGTALWAAVEHFPTLTSIHAYEREPAFISLGKTLAQSSASSQPSAKPTGAKSPSPAPSPQPTHNILNSELKFKIQNSISSSSAMPSTKWTPPPVMPSSYPPGTIAPASSSLSNLAHPPPSP